MRLVCVCDCWHFFLYILEEQNSLGAHASKNVHVFAKVLGIRKNRTEWWCVFERLFIAMSKTMNIKGMFGNASLKQRSQLLHGRGSIFHQMPLQSYYWYPYYIEPLYLEHMSVKLQMLVLYHSSSLCYLLLPVRSSSRPSHVGPESVAEPTSNRWVLQLPRTYLRLSIPYLPHWRYWQKCAIEQT